MNTASQSDYEMDVIAHLCVKAAAIAEDFSFLAVAIPAFDQQQYLAEALGKSSKDLETAKALIDAAMALLADGEVQ